MAHLPDQPTSAPDGKGIRRAWQRLGRDQRGSTAVEFAIIAPIFFFLMFVIAETALIFIAEQVMDNAVFESARLIRTGQAQQGTWPKPSPPACGGSTGYTCPSAGAVMSKADFRQEICKRMSVFINCANLYLDVKSYASFSAITTGQPLKSDGTTFENESFDAGGNESIVVVRAYYQWPTNKIFGSLSLANMSNGKRLIGSFAAFRNEPYDASS